MLVLQSVECTGAGIASRSRFLKISTAWRCDRLVLPTVDVETNIHYIHGPKCPFPRPLGLQVPVFRPTMYFRKFNCSEMRQLSLIKVDIDIRCYSACSVHSQDHKRYVRWYCPLYRILEILTARRCNSLALPVEAGNGGRPIQTLHSQECRILLYQYCQLE